MSDIRNIRPSGIAPHKIMRIIGGEVKEIKKAYKVIDGRAVVVWDISEDKRPVTYEFIFNITDGNFNFPQLTSPTYGIHYSDCTIDWGDDTKQTFDTYDTLSHMYHKSGVYTIKIQGAYRIISTKAFYGRNDLLSVKAFENALLGAGGANYIFAYCLNLTTIYFTNAQRTIDGNICMGCTSLKDIRYSPWLTNLSSGFSGCTSITEFDPPSTLTYFGNALNSTSITSINVKGSPTLDGTFYYCEKLTDITISSTIKIIKGMAFGFTAISTITLPPKITFLEGAFWGCSNLTSISLPSGITSLSQTFNGCSKLPDVSLPPNLQIIGNDTFSGCTSMLDIYIPSSVKSIGNYAFQKTKMNIHYQGTEGMWNAIAKSRYWSYGWKGNLYFNS